MIKVELAPLYQLGKKGETRIWKVWTEDDIIYTEYGVKDGKTQISRVKAEAKNIGKANATTAIEQAQKEAIALREHKLTRKYVESEAELKVKLLPMLAIDLEKAKISNKGFSIQRKLDGLRMISYWKNGEVVLKSRTNRDFHALHEIKKEIEEILPKDRIFDGEIYLENTSLQTIMSYASSRKEETAQLKYIIYDYPTLVPSEETFEERHAKLIYLNPSTSRLSCLETAHFSGPDIETKTQEELIAIAKEYEAVFLEEGYEGAIVRNWAPYEFTHRSRNLLKVKSFSDGEFEVVDVIEGKGKYEDLAVFICKNDLNDKTFKCTMATDFEEKALQLQEKEKYIGRKLTVKYKGRSDDGIPKIATGKAFRIDEDYSE